VATSKETHNIIILRKLKRRLRRKNKGNIMLKEVISQLKSEENKERRHPVIKARLVVHPCVS